jgi:hypothetical protein
MPVLFSNAEKEIRMCDLFDWRLEAHGVREIMMPETTRFLTDREGNTLMVYGDDDVSFCLGRGEPIPPPSRFSSPFRCASRQGESRSRRPGNR